MAVIVQKLQNALATNQPGNDSATCCLNSALSLYLSHYPCLMCLLSSGRVGQFLLYQLSASHLKGKHQDNEHLPVKGKQIRQAANCTLNALWGIRTWPSALLGQNTKAKQTLQDTRGGSGQISVRVRQDFSSKAFQKKALA